MENLTVAYPSDKKATEPTPETLINTKGFIDKYLCDTVEQSIKSIEKLLKKKKKKKCRSKRK